MKSLKVIEENKDWIVIDKPHGIIVEKNPFESPTVEEWLESYFEINSKKKYIGIVHRIDKATSGVMIVAKKKSVLKLLNEQFANRAVQKSYLAIVDKMPPEKRGNLNHYLFKDQKNKKAIIFEKSIKNTKPAILQYEHLASHNGMHLLQLNPKTGRFHQIRAQLGYIGCPILGDKKYGNENTYYDQSIALHAFKLTIDDLYVEKKISFKASLPNNKFWKEFSIIIGTLP
ncbi:MAG: RNA pseudouridine synthase [Bacteroidota bacterium]